LGRISPEDFKNSRRKVIDAYEKVQAKMFYFPEGYGYKIFA